MSKRITAVEIGRRAGVSHATVCDVLNGRWQEKRISVRTRDRVLRIAHKVNYRPNRLARSLRKGQSNIISLLVPAIANLYFPRLAYGVEAEAKKRGLHVLLCHIPSGVTNERAEIEMLQECRVDGMIIAPSCGKANRITYRQILKEKVPFVFVNDYFEDVPCSAVVGDDEQGAFLATSHLAELGHDRIAYLPCPPGPTVARMRLAGYQRALVEHGLRFRKEYVPDSKWEEETGYIQMCGLLRLPNPPSAVFGFSDSETIQGIRAVWEAGLRVPDDVAFVGYGDDLPVDWFHKVGLSTVRVDSEVMGCRAVQILVEEMKQPRLPKRIEKVPARLIVRQSCGNKRSEAKI